MHQASCGRQPILLDQDLPSQYTLIVSSIPGLLSGTLFLVWMVTSREHLTFQGYLAHILIDVSTSTYRLSNKLTKLTGSPPTATKAVFPGNRKEIRRARIDRNTNGIWIGLGEVYPNPVDKREIETNRSEQSTSINSCACIVRVKNASSMRASAQFSFPSA